MKLFVALLAATALAVPAAAQSEAAVTFTSQPTQGTWVTVDHVVLPAGGFVAVHEQSPTGDVFGASQYLEAGNHSHVPVELAGLNASATVYAVLYGDDGDEQFSEMDEPIVQGGQTVAAPAQVELGEVARVTFEDQELGAELHVAHVDLPSGGFVAIHRESFLDGEYFSSTVATSDALAPGNHTNVTVSVDLDTGGFYLAVVHRDTDGDGVYDFDISQAMHDPFYVDGTLAVMDRAAVRGAGDDPGTTQGAGRDGGSADNDTPAAIVLPALLAALAMARRR